MSYTGEAAAPSPRRTRSRIARIAVLTTPIDSVTLAEGNESSYTTASDVPLVSHPVVILPSTLTASSTQLPRRSLQLLLAKQAKLKKYAFDVPRRFEKHQQAIEATLVFAQEEAGTAVCISSDGLILTCAHCIAETEAQLDWDQDHWLLFRAGIAVSAKCVAWDERRDLALLRVRAAQPAAADVPTSGFPFVTVAAELPAPATRLVCIGQPGSEDLETSQKGVKTNYDVLHISTGQFMGCAEGQDPQDNSEIGALRHTCWTYWGHSGAPLLVRETGELIGLHSSWDDETGMRRGVALVAVVRFLEEHGVGDPAP